MKVAALGLAVIAIVLVVSQRQARETGESAERVRDVAHLLERAVADAPLPRPAPPSSRWIPEVNAECATREARLHSLRGPDDIARHAQDVLEVHRSFAGRVARLKPPRRFRTEAATINRLNARKVQVLTRVAASARAGDISGASRQARALRVLAGDANLLFLRLGLPQCPFTARSMPL